MTSLQNCVMEWPVVKKGNKLSDSEIKKINQVMAREFKASPSDKEKLAKTLFFLLKSGRKILAIGKLISIEPVYFQGESFSIMGIGGVAANDKGKGYGKKIIIAIVDYLSEHNKTGVGFCTLRNKVFYEKCGLKVDADIIKRFVFKDREKTITNEGDDCVVFYEKPDGLMKKVLAASHQEILLPRKPDW